MSIHQEIRDIIKSEICNHEFRKKDLINFCELKIENEVGKKINYYREDIFRTLRDISKHDPIIMKNIEDITADFAKKFTEHCDTEISKAKTCITLHLQTEVKRISDISPYDHIKEQHKIEMDAFRTQSNWLIASMAIINISVLAYLIKKSL